MTFEKNPEIVSELKKLRKAQPDYPKIKDIMSYSQVGLYEIGFNRDGLPLFDPPMNLFRGAPRENRISLSQGAETYVPRLFGEDESRLSNMMRCIIYYESQVIKRRINKDIKVIGNSGILQDLVTKVNMKYKIFSYDGQIFVSPTDRRINQYGPLVYSGKKFEQVMTNKTGPSDGSHFKSIQEVDLGNGSFKVLIASEIDSYIDGNKVYGLKKGHTDNKKIREQTEGKHENKSSIDNAEEVDVKEADVKEADVTEDNVINDDDKVDSKEGADKEGDSKGEEDDKCNGEEVDVANTEEEPELRNIFEGEEEDVIYVELKSMLCRGFKPGFFKLSPYLFLQELYSLKYNFWTYMFKIIIQCVFTNQKIIVFGIRNDSYKQLGIKLISLSTMIVFMRNYSPTHYERCKSAMDTINNELTKIIDSVEDGVVYQFDITPSQYHLHPLPQSEWKNELDKLIIKEFRDWREKGIVSDEIKEGKSYDRQLDSIANKADDYYLMKMIGSLEKLDLHHRIPYSGALA